MTWYTPHDHIDMALSQAMRVRSPYEPVICGASRTQPCNRHNYTRQGSPRADRRTDKTHPEWFFAKVNNVFVCSEVLGCPESLVAVGLFADKRSVRLGQVGAYVGLQMGFAKI